MFEVVEKETLIESNGRAKHDSIEASGGRRPHIVAILPRGEAIRNFIYTGVMDELAKEMEATLLSVIPSNSFRDLLQGRYQNIYELEEKREHRVVTFLRETLDMAHGRWLWSEAAQERWRLRDLEANTAPRMLKRLAKKLICYPLANPAGLELLSKLETRSCRWFRSTEEYIELFKQIKPALVFNGSHVHSRVAIRAVQAARALGIPTASFIFSWDNLTSQGRIIPQYDYYLVWNDSIRNQLLQIYPSIRARQVFVTGTPQFDFHFRRQYYWSREEFCERVGADPKRPIVLYSTGMPNHMPEEPRVVEGIADSLKKMKDFGPPQLLVRVYPKDRTNRFEQLKRNRPDILFPEVPWEPAWLTPKIEDAYLLTNTLRHAAVGINVASTVSLELCMLDKPVINVGYNPPGADISPIDYGRYYRFDHYRPIVESGAVEVAYSEVELRRMLIESLRHPEKLQY
ncbi:MAG TPA: hypothetical protein VIG62_03015, partial [Blastocatellia bacterium]